MAALTGWDALRAGNVEEALQLWREEYEQAPSAGALNNLGAALLELGRLMLWYGGLRTKDKNLQLDALKLLRKFWKVKDSTTIKAWPGPSAIAGYVLGKVSDALLLNRWREGNPVLESRRKARANFWVGLRTEHADVARTYFQKAFSEDRIAILEPEYFLAKWEYERLTAESR